MALGGYMLNRHNPASLHSHFLPELEERGNKSLPLRHRYQTLRRNDIKVEKESRNKYRLLTSTNWDRYLVNNFSRVYIPVSEAGIHWSLIETHGHDRIVELLYVGSHPLGRDIQLNFQPINQDGEMLDHAHPCYTVACRASKLDKYMRRMYYVMTEDERTRDKDRFRMVEWRATLG